MIERTRAEIVSYKHSTPFAGNGSVWSSQDKATIPVYEKSDPYEKLPKEVREKDMITLTLEDALLFARAADRPDRYLDRVIFFKAIFDPALKAGGDCFDVMGASVPFYTSSLNAVKGLYLDVPERMPTDVLDALVEALEQHCAQNKD